MSAGASGRERIINRSAERVIESRKDRAIDPIQRILESSRSLAVEQGRTSFTVQQITERAGVALQTFYRYFRSKDDCLLAMFEESMAAGIADIAASATELADPLERLKSIVTDPLAPDLVVTHLPAELVVREHLRLYAIYPREIERSVLPFRELIADTIREAQSIGHFPNVDPDVEAELIHHLVMSRFHMVKLAAFIPEVEDPAEELWQFCLGALKREDDSERYT
jgi:AcrR family transcriptional regulator